MFLALRSERRTRIRRAAVAHCSRRLITSFVRARARRDSQLRSLERVAPSALVRGPRRAGLIAPASHANTTDVMQISKRAMLLNKASHFRPLPELQLVRQTRVRKSSHQCSRAQCMFTTKARARTTNWRGHNAFALRSHALDRTTNGYLEQRARTQINSTLGQNQHPTPKRPRLDYRTQVNLPALCDGPQALADAHKASLALPLTLERSNGRTGSDSGDSSSSSSSKRWQWRKLVVVLVVVLLLRFGCAI